MAGEGLTFVRQIAEIIVGEMELAGIPIEYTGGDRGWVGDVPYFQYDCGKIHSLGFQPTYDSTQAVQVAVRRMLGKQD